MGERHEVASPAALDWVATSTEPPAPVTVLVRAEDGVAWYVGREFTAPREPVGDPPGEYRYHLEYEACGVSRARDPWAGARRNARRWVRKHLAIETAGRERAPADPGEPAHTAKQASDAGDGNLDG